MKLCTSIISFALVVTCAQGFNSSSVFELFLEGLESTNLESMYTEKANTRHDVQMLLLDAVFRIQGLKKIIEPEAKQAIVPLYLKMWNKLAIILQPISTEFMKLFDKVIETIWKVRVSQNLLQSDLSFIEIFSSILIQLSDDVEVSTEFLKAFSDSEEDLEILNEFVLDYLDEVAEEFPNFKIILNNYYDVVYEILQHVPITQVEVEVFSLTNIFFLAMLAH